MTWLAILAAGLFETGFAVSLKLSGGLTRLWPTVSFAVCAVMSFALLTVALRKLEVGAAYAVWTGIGAAGTALVGMIFLPPCLQQGPPLRAVQDRRRDRRASFFGWHHAPAGSGAAPSAHPGLAGPV